MCIKTNNQKVDQYIPAIFFSINLITLMPYSTDDWHVIFLEQKYYLCK